MKRRPMNLVCRGAGVAAAVTLLALTLGARAQPFETPPPPAAPRELRIGAPIEQALPNGLRVVLAERRGVQLVSAQLLVLSGSEADPLQRAGLASLTAGLLTKGTRRYSASALARAAETLGGSLESAAGWNRSTVAITVAVPQLDAALGLVGEAVLRPSFAPAELERLRAQALDEMKVAYSQPGTLAALAAQHVLFGTGPYGHPAGGTPVSLPRIQRADLQALHALRFRPDNAVLVLSGDLDASTALKLANKHFGTWKRPATALPTAGVASAGLPPALTVIDMPLSGQAAVVVVLPIPDSEPDRAARDVMNSVLGGGYSSRLNQEIRIKRGLSYGAGSRLEARRQPARSAQRRRSAAGCGANQERVGGRGAGAGAGRARRPDQGAGRKRRAGGAQGDADRRLQPQRRNHRRAE